MAIHQARVLDLAECQLSSDVLVSFACVKNRPDGKLLVGIVEKRTRLHDPFGWLGQGL